ncbi:MAG: PilC/PilY family type IV pilus protein [Candidatus Aminicenantales bacterium]
MIIRKKTRRFLYSLPPLLALLVLTAGSRAQEPATCVEQTSTFLENFDTETYKDIPASSVANWPSGPITLNQLGANFDVLLPNGMGAHIYVCEQGDFTGDGKPDLIGLDITNDINRLILVRNQYVDADGNGVDDDGIIFYIDPTEVYDDGLDCGPAAITVGDYNNDGLLDFFFMKNDVDEFGYTNFVAAMYINRGTNTNPDFRQYTESPNLNFSSLFKSKYVYINWAANHLSSVDIDRDGDLDILIISQDKIFLLRNPGPSNFRLSRFNLAELSYNRKTGYSSAGGIGSRGGSAIAAGDFNGDGYVDIVTGTVNNQNYLAMYLNDKKGIFTRWDVIIPRPECTGTVGLCAQDFNLDGRTDIFGGTDAFNAGNEAHIWIYLNRGVPPPPGTGVTLEFRCLADCQPVLPPPHDVDVCVPVDYDGDGDRDIILADANHSGDYYLIKNNIADVYAVHGEAVSTNVAGTLDPARFAVTQVQVSSLRQGVQGGSSTGLTVDLFVSGNGSDWERYATFAGADIHDYTNLPVHKFLHFGAKLLWKAVLNAPVDPMVEYQNASFETPYIDEIEFQFTYVERREYSRTSVTATVTDELNRQVKLIIGASFYFPGWQGQLRAYDLTDMPTMATSESVLRTITRSDLSSPTGREIVAENVKIYWDAGKLLASRTPDSRLIYTALKPGGVLTRLDFSTANSAELEEILQDFNNDPEGLINFVRGSERDWKLGDMNHSSPVVVDPPAGDESRMGPGYSSFKQSWTTRPSCLYVGANDGMLHCFDVKTGEERWAFIPYNLLPKLRNMWAVDPSTGERSYDHDVYVDGTPAVSDAYIDANRDGSMEWATILVCGQGPGMGSTVGGGLNYYFALDITDPENPQPLWEFTDPTMGETWSRPLLAKVKKNGVDTWVAFMGSGYDNDPDRVVGNNFNAITLNDGVKFWSFEASDYDTSGRWPSGINIYNTLPGSPNGVDLNQDGFIDTVYIGDLDGRIWKVDVSPDWVHQNSWRDVVLYTDSSHYPIITKPAIWVNSTTGASLPRLYFGTGGDDAAPDNVTYSFVSLRDAGSAQTEWFIGDAGALGLDPLYDKGDFTAGEKVWADPQVANFMVFFSTLTGNIESVDPCQDIVGEGKLYARFLEAIGGGVAGGTALKTAAGPMEYMALEIKARAAVTLGGTETTGGLRKREIYIHEFNSTIQKLEQPVGATLKVKSWREVYHIR